MLETVKLNCKIEFVKFTFKELLAVCPVTTEVDSYTLQIEFSPNDYSLEVITLKSYLLKFQGTSIFAENLANEICNELYSILKPFFLSVKLIRNFPENGIGIEVFQQLGWEGKL